MSHAEPKDISVEFLLTREFVTSEEFSTHIEKEAKERGITVYEMVIEYCEEKNLDPTAAASIITHRLKQLILAEAEKLNLMKKKTPRLPL